MPNSLELIVLGVDSRVPQVNRILLTDGKLPNNPITDGPIDEAARTLFEKVTGYSSQWGKPELIDVLQSNGGVKVFFGCLISTDTEITNGSFEELNDNLRTGLSEQVYNVINKACQKRFK